MEYNYFVYSGCIFRIPKNTNDRLYNALEMLCWLNKDKFTFSVNAFSRECAEEININRCNFRDFKKLFLEIYTPILGKEKAMLIFDNDYVFQNQKNVDLIPFIIERNAIKTKTAAPKDYFISVAKKAKPSKRNFEYCASKEMPSDSLFDWDLVSKV